MINDDLGLDLDLFNNNVKFSLGCFDMEKTGRMSLNEPRYEKTGFLHICENKDADQLRSNCAADQRLCFRYTASTIPLLPKTEISSI